MSRLAQENKTLKCFTCTYFQGIKKPHEGCLDKPDQSYLMWCNEDEICQNMVKLKKNAEDFEEDFLMVSRECRHRNNAICNAEGSSKHCVDVGVDTQECFNCCSEDGCLADLTEPGVFLASGSSIRSSVFFLLFTLLLAKLIC